MSPRRTALVLGGVALALSIFLVLRRFQSNAAFAGTRAGQTRNDNGLGTTLVWIPPGKFTMGSPRDEKGHSANENQVPVTLTKGFWLGQHEVTQGEWRRVMPSSPWSGKKYAKEGDDFPATFVSCDDAITFCKKLTEQESAAGRLPWGWQYTLPTEAQWEYACRAGNTSRFCFGDDESKLGEYAWFDKNARETGAKFAQAVGGKNPNSWGLHDMHGNVFEWCRDWYEDRLSGGTDPQGPPDGSGRVNKGGGWIGEAALCRSASRDYVDSDAGFDGVGFRLAAVRSGQ